MKESWKPIAGYPLYEVSSLGRVRSWKNNRHGRRDVPKALKTGAGSHGYKQIVLRRDGVVTTKTIHRLVMAAFVGESGLEVNHINGDKADNRLSNLEYCTSSENSLHARDMLDGVGVQVLSRTQVEEIITLLAEGNGSQGEIAVDYGVVRKTVSLIWTGKGWSDLSRPWPLGTNYNDWRKILRKAS